MEVSKVLNQKISIAQTECKGLTLQLAKAKRESRDATLQSLATNCRLPVTDVSLRQYRTLSGHFDKILDIAWMADEKHIVSVSQDGFMLIWNAVTGLKSELIELDDPWVICCNTSADGRLVATGGLENACIVYKTSLGQRYCVQDPQQGLQKGNSVLSIFKGHKEYISGLSFLSGSSNQIVTCSGDRTSILWDTTKGGSIRNFCGHLGDVLALSANPIDNNSFVTCSCDRMALLWDARSPVSVRRYVTSTQCDASSIEFFPDGHSFACGTDDGTIKLFDLRSDGDIATYDVQTVRQYMYQHGSNLLDCSAVVNGSQLSSPIGSVAGSSFESSFQSAIDSPGVLSMSFSKSGRLLFVSYEEFNSVIIVDTITGQVVGTLDGHKGPISKIAISKDGLGVATGSRDHTLKIWSV